MTLVGILAIAACDAQLPSPPPIQSTPPAEAATATPTPTWANAPGATAPPVLVRGSLGGYWRVQETPDPTTGLAFAKALERRTFLVFQVEPGCAKEPCQELTVSVLLPTYRTRLDSVTLKRRGDIYESEPSSTTEGPCTTDGGSALEGAATVIETMRLWLNEVRHAGTAVVSIELGGEVSLVGTPSGIGKRAGCMPWKLRYAIAGSRTGPPAGPSTEPTGSPRPRTADLVARPNVGLSVKGATVLYFNVKGSTVASLLGSVAAGGLKACGRISYEWYSGDTRPAGCMKTRWLTFDVTGDYAYGGACRTHAEVTARYTVVLPRWTSPATVLRPLANWWTAVVRFIRDHEAGHVAIARKWVAKFPGLLDGQPCAKTQQIIDKWAAGMSAAQELYDRTEYAKPWPPAPYGY